MFTNLSALTVGLVGNLGLATSKTALGWMAGSSALFADGLHSFTDVLSAIISWIGSRIAGDPPDEDHPFGHGAADNLAAFLVAMVMVWAGFLVIRGALRTISTAKLEAPEAYAAVIALVCLAIKEVMHRHALAEWQRTGSPTILALAKDHRSDGLSSIAAFVGILGARLGQPLLDPLASMVIAGLILKLAWEIAAENLQVLLDREPDVEHLREELSRRTEAHEVEMTIYKLRAHQAGTQINLEIDLRLAPEMTLARAHEIAHQVEDWTKEIDSRVFGVQIHVEPFELESPPSEATSASAEEIASEGTSSDTSSTDRRAPDNDP